MKYSKKFTISFLSVIFISVLTVQAQRATDCDIPVKTTIQDADKGKGNGEITLEFEAGTSLKSIKIFYAQPGARGGLIEAEDRRLTGLRAGFYDIMIVDTSRKECAKQMTVEVKTK